MSKWNGRRRAADIARGELAELGFMIERFGPEQEAQAAIMVREVPALMYKGNVAGLLKDMAEEIDALGQGLAVKEHLESFPARWPATRRYAPGGV